MMNGRVKRYWSSNLAIVTVQGFASGLSVALLGPLLQAWFTQNQISLAHIGLLSLIALPYALKFLWAPLFDAVNVFGHDQRKSWLLLLQLTIVALILIMANLVPQQQAFFIAVVAFMVALFSASQDTVNDAQRTEILPEAARGLGSACYIFAYRIAALVSGGFSLIIADYLGFKATYQLLALLLAVCAVVSFLLPSQNNAVRSKRENFLQVFFHAVGDLLQREKIILLLLLVIFYKFGDALALQLMTPFLLHTLGFSLSEVGIAYKTVGFAASMLGAMVSGVLLTRWELYSALMMFAIAQAFSNLLFAALAVMGHNMLMLSFSMFIENFCSGMSTAALMVLLMSLCQRNYTATQYALLSAIASVGRIFLGPVASYLVAHVGWIQFYILSCILCFPGIIFLVLLKSNVREYAHAGN